MNEQVWWDRCKAAIREMSRTSFGSESNADLYIRECEHMEGDTYWDNFKSEQEALEDFWLYCKNGDLIEFN